VFATKEFNIMKKQWIPFG